MQLTPRIPAAAWAHLAAHLAALLLGGAPAAHAATVSITGQLTSFQAALSPFTAGGDGTLNGVPLAIDPNAAPLHYPNDVPPNSTAWPQSTVVALPAGTLQAQFEYTSFIGTANQNPNRISFTPAAAAQVAVGDTFKLGTLSFTNGFWTPAATIGLSITTHSADPALDNHSFTGRIQVVVSNYPISVTDPQLNADFFYLSDANGPLTPLGSVRVYEQGLQPAGNPGNTGSADLYARIGSLVPTGFANATGGAFLSPSIVQTSPVPEASTSGLLSTGLAGLAVLAGATRRRRARRLTVKVSRR